MEAFKTFYTIVLAAGLSVALGTAIKYKIDQDRITHQRIAPAEAFLHTELYTR
jgi:hypothetical protein